MNEAAKEVTLSMELVLKEVQMHLKTPRVSGETLGRAGPLDDFSVAG
jgi:hypothetical protein